jgi:hypothetical protein
MFTRKERVAIPFASKVEGEYNGKVPVMPVVMIPILPLMELPKF